jgi:hypothetical protein
MNPADVVLGAAIGAGAALLVVVLRLLTMVLGRRFRRSLSRTSDRITGESGR